MRLSVRLVKFNTKEMQEKKQAVISKIARKGVKIFRQEIKKRRLINTGNLLRSVGATIQKNGVRFDIDADYAGILNKGIRKHKMRYLTDKGPIPIVTNSGKTIFRIATSKSMSQKGKWMHPGFKRGMGFFDAGVAKIETFSKELISESLV